MSGTSGTPAIISTLAVLPFIVLESLNTQGFAQGFPLVLFGVMWLLAFTFILLLKPIVPSLRGDMRGRADLLRLLPRVAALILISWFWVVLVLDQMPCFLGVPNCD